MSLLFSTSTFDVEEWLAALRRHLPDVDVHHWPDEADDPAEVEYVLIQSVGKFDYSLYPNLRIVFTMGAGADYILSKPELPAGVPIVRMVSSSIVEAMTHYVQYAVLHFHRGFQRFRENQISRIWEPIRGPANQARRVGVMGLGPLGDAVARTIAAMNFPTAGWAVDPPAIEGVTVHDGPDALNAFLARTDILVCLLPLTPGTRGILNTRTFAQLPRGAIVINVARGQHLVEEDLLEALESGHLAGAMLDVFIKEPLPPEHPFWSNPRIVVTPHSGGFNDADAAAAHVAWNIDQFYKGEPLAPLVDRTTGF
jgi:glyoxylate/hydroxypyruvate reductase